MQIQIQEITSNYIQKGPKGYTQLEVVYTANGKNSTKKLFSFSNPQVFNVIKDATSGSNWEIEVKKNGEYWDWVKATPAGEAVAAPVARSAPTGGKVLGSSYETPEERKLRQLYIIKQSSISNAIELLSVGQKAPPDVKAVLDTAQQFVDYVYGNVDLFDQPNELPE
jgi:hypothetical protein